MALQKEIELENGVTLKYHRIASINKITNICNNIEVNSYTSEEKRNKEKEYQLVQKKNSADEELTDEEKEILEKGINVFIESEYIQIPYNENMTIENAYDFLKTLDKYKKSKNV